MLKDNSAIPASSGSRLYNNDGYLYWGGSGSAWPHSMIAPTIHIDKLAYNYNGSSRVYVPFGALYEFTSITYTYTRTTFPWSGRLLSVTVISNYSGGSTDITFHKNENTTAIETQTTSIDAVDTPYRCNFSGSAFDADDLLHIGIDVTTSNNHVHNVILVWQLNVEKPVFTQE